MSPIVLGTIIAELMSLVYPVGSIFMTTNGENPAAGFGFGHWVPWGEGRVPVGTAANDPAFNTVEKTGGEKAHAMTAEENGPHSHDFVATNNSGATWSPVGPMGRSGPYPAPNGGLSTTVASHAEWMMTIGNSGSAQPHNNLQPYITCYMWKRIA